MGRKPGFRCLVIIVNESCKIEKAAFVCVLCSLLWNVQLSPRHVDFHNFRFKFKLQAVRCSLLVEFLWTRLKLCA